MTQPTSLHRIGFCFLLAFGLLLTACQAPSLPAQALPTLTPTPLALPTLAEIDQSTPVLPTPTPNFSGSPVQVSELQHFQQGTRLTVIAKLINTLPDATIRDVQVEVLAVDSSGTRIAQGLDEIKFIFPGETTGIVRVFELQADIYTSTTEVRITGGYVDQNNTYAQPFAFEQPTFFGGTTPPVMTGWLLNANPATYTEVAINAIGYNGRGEIIGAGRTQMAFAPGDDRVGVSIPSSFIGQPERVELFAWLGPHSAALEAGSWWNAVGVRDWNFVISPTNQIAGGAEWVNETDFALRKTWYALTVYDDLGEVNLVDTGFIDTIWAGETLHFAPPILYAPTDSQPTHVDLLVVPGEVGPPLLEFNPLRASQAVVETSSEVPVGKVTVINNLNARISDALVMMTIRNENGQLVGSGFAPSGAINANSAVVVTVPVYIHPPYQGFIVNASVIMPEGVKIGE